MIFRTKFKYKSKTFFKNEAPALFTRLLSVVTVTEKCTPHLPFISIYGSKAPDRDTEEKQTREGLCVCTCVHASACVCECVTVAHCKLLVG